MDNPRPDVTSFATAHRRAGKVRRWHTEFTVQTQTISDHVYNMMRIYFSIWGMPDNPMVWAKILMHDFEELYIGDLPHWTSHLSLMASAKETLESEVHALHPALDYAIVDDDGCIKIADWIEALEFMLDELRLGNHTLRFGLGRLYSKLMELIKNREDEEAIMSYMDQMGFTTEYGFYVDGVMKGDDI